MAIQEALMIAYKFQELGVKAGFLKFAEELYANPALMGCAEKLCLEMHDRVFYWNKQENKNPWDYSTRISYTMWFCFYAGAGAYCLWQMNDDSFQPLSLIDDLSKPKGFDCIDEYVEELLGIRFGSDESKRLRMHIFGDLVPILGKYSTLVQGDEEILLQLLECMKGIFDYGIMFARSYLMSK